MLGANQAIWFFATCQGSFVDFYRYDSKYVFGSTADRDLRIVRYKQNMPGETWSKRT